MTQPGGTGGTGPVAPPPPAQPPAQPVIAPPAPAVAVKNPPPTQVPAYTKTGTNAVPAAVVFDAPLLNPSPTGLFAATSWTENTGPSRWLGEGVLVRQHNYGGHHAFGVWDATWCAQPDDLKSGTRPTDLPAFEPMVVWAYDECDLTAPSREEVRTRAAQNLRMQEQTAIEREFAARLIADIGGSAATDSGSIEFVVGDLEGRFAEAGTVGYIHASPVHAALLASKNLLIRSGASLKSPLGHTWVFGGGYVRGLAAGQFIATSQPFGWRDPAVVRESIDATHNVFSAIAERAVVIGYEALIGAATLTSN